MALTFLTKQRFVAGKEDVRLTNAGREAHGAFQAIHARVEQTWSERLDRLRAAVQALLDQRDAGRPRLALGLEPHPEGVASSRYLPQTRAVLADPTTGLPRHPMVLYRGGWPDGS